MKVTILRGISGSGKSTYAKTLNPDIILSADDFFMVNGTYKFDPALLSAAHGDCLRRFATLIDRPKDRAPSHIVVDNTNTTVAEVAPYAALALAYGCELEIVTVNPNLSWEIGAERNAHNVPAEVIQNQWKRLSEERLPIRWPQSIAHT